MSNRTRFCYYLLSWAIIFGVGWVAVGAEPQAQDGCEGRGVEAMTPKYDLPTEVLP